MHTRQLGGKGLGRARWCYAPSGRATSQCPVKLVSGATAGTALSVPAVGPSMKPKTLTQTGLGLAAALAVALQIITACTDTERLRGRTTNK